MIIFCDGCKGGVGKSPGAAIAIEVLLEAGHSVGLVDTDTSVIDNFKRYKKLCDPCVYMDLRDTPIKTKNGDIMGVEPGGNFNAFLELVSQYTDRDIVVSCGAQDLITMKLWGEFISLLNVPFKTLWFVGGAEDSALMLKQYIRVIPADHVVIVKNCHFAKGYDDVNGVYKGFEAFDRIINSEINNFAGVVYFPDLTVSSAMSLFENKEKGGAKLPFCEILDHPSLGILPRVLFKRWFDNAKKIISSAIIE